jgi:hypothetical protein
VITKESNIAPGGYVALTGSSCNHMSNACTFNHTLSIEFAHINSTIPHALGTSQWNLPHVAQQYNS